MKEKYKSILNQIQSDLAEFQNSGEADHFNYGSELNKFYDRMCANITDYEQLCIEKEWKIDFVREFEGKSSITHISINKPTEKEAIELIKSLGFIFNEEYDEIKKIYEI